MKPLSILFAVLILFLAVPNYVFADWKPPQNPVPLDILKGAETDALAGNFEDALAKHVWFFNHALEYERTLDNVRLSTALSQWQNLGKQYPPALDKLRETRNNATKKVIGNQGNIIDSFRDMYVINELLNDSDMTVATFILIDRMAPGTAQSVYHMAQQGLVQKKYFGICSKYLAADKSYADLLEDRRIGLEAAELETLLEYKPVGEASERVFINNGAVLIALLVVNDRKPEAERIATKLRDDSKYAGRAAVIDAALNGTFPREYVETEGRSAKQIKQ